MIVNLETSKIMNSRKLGQILFNDSMSVTAIIPIGWHDLDTYLSDDFRSFLEQDPEVICETLDLSMDVSQFIHQASTPLDRLDTLINTGCDGFLCILQGRVFKRSGPDSWSSTCATSSRYVYARNLEDLPAEIGAAAKALKQETFPEEHPQS